ncbi:TPA: hypothetical protein HA351_07540 [Methanosarcinaceae archaeon]|nr:hypothetical protein [Methanosarcinaceae archaeon]
MTKYGERRPLISDSEEKYSVVPSFVFRNLPASPNCGSFSEKQTEKYSAPGFRTLYTFFIYLSRSSELLQISIGGNVYYALSDSLELLSKLLARSKLKILSPFDNLLIQRKRMQTLFGFDYQVECYVPKAKRQYGYFSLPILWDGKLVARMDCKADRKESMLHIYHLALEPWLKKT